MADRVLFLQKEIAEACILHKELELSTKHFFS